MNATLDGSWISCGLRWGADKDWPWSRTIRGAGRLTAMFAERLRTWILRGRGQTADVVADWLRSRLWRGHGLDASADSVPDIHQHRLGRYPSIAWMLAE